MNAWRLSIATRMFGSAANHRLMSVLGLLSVGGLALAVAVLVTVLSVMNGFEREMRERVLSVLPHGTLYARTQAFDWQASRERALAHPDVLGAAPVVEGNGLVLAGSELQGINFRGVDPVLEESVSILPGMMVEGSLDDLSPGSFGVVLGAELAATMDVGVGDDITLVLPQARFTLAGPGLTTRRLQVVGVFEVKADADKELALIELNDAKRLKRQPLIDGVVVKLDDLFDAPRIMQELIMEDKTVYGVSWMGRYGNLYDAIGTQKATMFLLLLVLVAVAAFNVVSNLVMTVDDNRSGIAILRTMGASPSDIRMVFLMHGLLVGGIGLTAGLIFGLLLTATISPLFSFVSTLFDLNLMSEYFIRYLPTQVLLIDLVIISGVTLLICLLTTIYPASRAANADPVEALQYEV